MCVCLSVSVTELFKRRGRGVALPTHAVASRDAGSAISLHANRFFFLQVAASQLDMDRLRKKRFSLCCFEREFVAPGSAGAQRVRYGGDARRTKNLSGERQAQGEIW